jgi:predicted transcriptional regulator
MGRRFLFWGFKTSRELLDQGLGSLEREVIAFAWTHGEASVRDVCNALGSSVAYTTVMTTMDRLFKKGLLARRKVGRAFVYRAAASREEMERAATGALFGTLLDRKGTEPLPLLSSLIDAVSDRDRALLGDLERLIQEKRRELERGTDK